MAEEGERGFGFGGEAGGGGFGGAVETGVVGREGREGGAAGRERQAEVQSLLLRLRQYQAQAEATLRQLNVVNQAIEEILSLIHISEPTRPY